MTERVSKQLDVVLVELVPLLCYKRDAPGTRTHLTGGDNVQECEHRHNCVCRLQRVTRDGTDECIEGIGGRYVEAGFEAKYVRLRSPPKSVTLDILKDTPDASAWRVDVVDDKGQSHSYSWNGPTDGSMQDLKTADGQVIGKESVKRDGDTLVRHGEDPKDGSSFDARSTLSADGNTITDVVTTKSKDGKTSKTTGVFHRVAVGKTGGR